MKAALIFVALCAAAGACGSGAAGPADLQAGTPCSHCRMTVLEPKLASQLVAPGEEPRFFDDLGCLTAYLPTHPAAPGARVFVADHATGAWVDAGLAVYTRVATIATPMNSHVIAHANAQARDADAAARDGVSLTPADLFGQAGPPGANRVR